MDDSLGNNLLANGVLAAVYVVYKIVDRCLNSKCKYTQVDGLSFDLDGEGDCPVADMEQIADLLKARATQYARGTTTRVGNGERV